MEKGIALAFEKPCVRQEIHGSCSSCQSDRGGTNHGAKGQVGADELARPRHHEARRRSGILIEIGKHQSIPAVHGRSISRLVIPDFEMRHFRPFDAGNNSQGEETAAFEAQRVVKARSALLDHRKVERGCIRDRLHLVG